MKTLLYFVLLILPLPALPQFLSNLRATRNDALFTTYAAPLTRSEYKTDQGYQFTFNDPESGIEMISADGPNFGLAMKSGNELRFRLKEMFEEPVITTSYSDILKYHYSPFKDIRVEVCFDVYSSGSAFMDFTITNTGKFNTRVTLIPYHYYPSADSAANLEHDNLSGGYVYPLIKKPDSWMKEHQIPVTTSLTGNLLPGLQFDSLIAISFKPVISIPGQAIELENILRSIRMRKFPSPFVNAVFVLRTIRLEPGECTKFRICLSLNDASNGKQNVFGKLKGLMAVDPATIIMEDEKIYNKIPVIKLPDRDYEMLYWSCFSLMRQCMMPPEGKCHYNYYIFSREPKWGWGYGGQVFHESLSMLAYAYMDPAGAMNSQRVFMERQHTDGYINYRTGPYLDETIPFGNKLTTSAPWFNYINLEIYKISKDRKFLKEAYTSGKRFYTFFIKNRDSNKNGLCEWGAEGELESVRDSRVAVWDNVGRPMNFEGPDLNSMLVMETKSLSEMAGILGYKADAQQWKGLSKQRSALIEHYLWDSLTHFYYNVFKMNQTFTFRAKDDLKIREIIGFLPLWAGVTGKDRAGLLTNSLFNPGEFWRPFGVPSLTASSDYYNPIGYWNGPVWVQWNYLIYRGLKDYKYDRQASDLIVKVLNNMIWNLKQDHVFWEFYSADDHEAGWNKTYIWAGIAARMLIDEYSTK
jgi:hypothetical protein